jgi:hypothetical protein
MGDNSERISDGDRYSPPVISQRLAISIRLYEPPCAMLLAPKVCGIAQDDQLREPPPRNGPTYKKLARLCQEYRWL